jgi:hypothetical protein
MNIERLLRDVDKRLEHVDADVRREVADAIREEAARTRRFHDPAATLETERERRVEAELLRDVLEAINRQARLEDTIEEVLRQLARVVDFDSCSIGLFEDGHCRIIAARGFEDSSKVVGLRFRAPVLDEMRERHWPLSLADVSADPRFAPQVEGGAIRSWAGLPLLVEGQVLGVLNLDRQRVDPFSDDDLHRARTVAFSAAAAIRNATVLEHVRGYAQLMEVVGDVAAAVFARRPLDVLRQTLLRGALRIGRYSWGLLIERREGGAELVAACSAPEHARAVGRAAPAELWTTELRRFDAVASADLGTALDIEAEAGEWLALPLRADERVPAVLVLLDTDGESPAERLLEAYASRAGEAYAHALAER